MVDQHYTPRWVARIVADALPRSFSGAVLDPAAGSGSLLDGVVESGQHSPLVALDIDRRTVQSLRRARPDWFVGGCDSLDARSRGASPAWRWLQRNEVAWVLLNPPFSYRGGPSVEIGFGRFKGKVSPPIAFLAMALGDVNPSGGVVAILPEGSIFGAKFEGFWEELSTSFVVEEIVNLRNSAFHGVRANCRIMRISRVSGGTTGRQPVVAQREFGTTGCVCVEIVRGRVPRHRSITRSGDDVAYVHTTDLTTGGVVASGAVAPRSLATAGPAILIPRVGFPGRKIALLPTEDVVLSDCVIALRPLNRAVESLLANVRADAETISTLYVGTGAPYVTVPKLATYLERRGLRPLTRPASSVPGECSCGRGLAAFVDPVRPIAASVVHPMRSRAWAAR